jgi:hypothetical protein
MIGYILQNLITLLNSLLDNQHMLYSDDELFSKCLNYYIIDLSNFLKLYCNYLFYTYKENIAFIIPNELKTSFIKLQLFQLYERILKELLVVEIEKLLVDVKFSFDELIE